MTWTVTVQKEFYDDGLKFALVDYASSGATVGGVISKKITGFRSILYAGTSFGVEATELNKVLVNVSASAGTVQHGSVYIVSNALTTGTVMIVGYA